MGEWEVCVRPVRDGSPAGAGWEPVTAYWDAAVGDRVLWRRRSGPSEAAQSAVLRDCVRGQPSGSRVVADLHDVVDLLDRDGQFESPDWPDGHLLVRVVDAWRAAGKPGLPEVPDAETPDEAGP